MTARNVVARIIKLEAGQRRQDALLLVWRKPSADVREAVSGADYSPGDRVICVEWFSDKPMPAPKWHYNRLRFDDETAENLNRAMDENVARSLKGSQDPAFIACPVIPQHKMVRMTDHELWHSLYGVAT